MQDFGDLDAARSQKHEIENRMRSTLKFGLWNRVRSRKLKGKWRRALQYWQESVQLGERIGARLELARTWSEVGRRLLEAESGTKSLNGVSAEEYLTRARAFFQEKET